MLGDVVDSSPRGFIRAVDYNMYVCVYSIAESTYIHTYTRFGKVAGSWNSGLMIKLLYKGS